MTPAQLLAEITDDPEQLGYAAPYGAGNDVAVAALLNAESRPYRRPVPLEIFAAECLQLNLTGGVLALLEIPLGAEIAEGVTMDVQTKGLLHQVITLVQSDFRLVNADVDDVKFGPACDGLIALGVIDAAGKAALLALGDGLRSRAAELGWPRVSPDDVFRTRAIQ